MTVKQRGSLIGAIIAQLRFTAWTQKKVFDAGDIFISLAFKDDAELLKIVRLCGV